MRKLFFIFGDTQNPSVPAGGFFMCAIMRYSTAMTIRYIDIHTHLNLEQFADDADAVIRDMEQAGVAGIVVGTTTDTSNAALALAQQHTHLFACVGVHPVAEPHEHVVVQVLASQVIAPGVVALGETGFDWFRTDKAADTERQESNFLKHVGLAIIHDKPLMLHLRPSPGTVDAYDDMLAILTALKPQYGDKLRGNAHFFAGTAEQALAFNALGFTVSFTGVITFTHEYDEVIRAVPLGMMHAETDAPFVAPVPYRGQRCVPQHVIAVYEQIAAIRQEDPEVVRLQLLENARRMFGVPVGE